jgi:hypothetical protein
MRLLLKFVPDEGEDDQNEDDVAEDTAEWGAFGFMFVLGVLSFDEAKPRNLSTADYHEKDEFNVADFIEQLRFVRSELHFDADYIRGRRIKTRIAVRPNGTVRLETIGRGKAVLRQSGRWTLCQLPCFHASVLIAASQSGLTPLNRSCNTSTENTHLDYGPRCKGESGSITDRSCI